EIPSSRAISALLRPVAGMTVSASRKPGWVGGRLRPRFASRTVITPPRSRTNAGSMVLLEIDLHVVCSFECEGYAPGPVDVYRVPHRLESPEAMKVKAGDIKIAGSLRRVEGIQPRQDAPKHLRIDPGCPTRRPELGQSLMPEALDHTICKPIADT